MRRFHTIIVCSALLLAWSVSASWAEGILIVGNESKPPKISSVDGAPQGILIEIARYVEAKMPGYDFQFGLYPWSRAYDTAKNGEAGIIGLSKTASRMYLFDYSEVVFVDEVVVVVKKGHEFPFSTIEDFRGKRIGIGRGVTFGDDFDRAVQSGTFEVVEDNGGPMRLAMLLEDRIDAALISPGTIAVDRLIESSDRLRGSRDAFTVLPVPFKNDPNYLAFHKSMHMAEFLNAFNQIIRKGYASGEIPAIIARQTQAR